MPKPNAPKPINWIAVRAEYEAGGISLRQLAEKVGTSRATIERRSSKEGWASGEGSVRAEVRAEVATRVRAEIITQRVERTLNILAEIDKGLWECIGGIADCDFKSKEGAIAGFDKLTRLRLELSDDYIDERLFKRGKIAVPIAELSPPSEDTKSEGEQESGSRCSSPIALDTVMARAAEIEPTIIPASERDISVLLSRETSDRIQES